MKTVIWENISSLMVSNWGKENLTRLSREAKIGPATCSRIKEQNTSVGIEVIEAVAKVFGVQPWQMLVKGLDPTHLPQLISTEAEKTAYSIGKSAMDAAKATPH